jgi:hypothetical protein
VPLAAMTLTHDNLSHPAEYDRQPLLGFVSQEARKTPPARWVATTKVCGAKIEQQAPSSRARGFFWPRSVLAAVSDRRTLFAAARAAHQPPAAWVTPISHVAPDTLGGPAEPSAGLPLSRRPCFDGGMASLDVGSVAPIEQPRPEQSPQRAGRYPATPSPHQPGCPFEILDS